ncbi:carbohydrate porin [Hymenobacter crusticola]|uniref:carbohydrate porin n=1 Tax=Hymenobacter crusticola TaxID=1770526 RepID=UPI001C5014F8|nr:carbohydrate porin [Hymenobacter crusticola]
MRFVTRPRHAAFVLLGMISAVAARAQTSPASPQPAPPVSTPAAAPATPPTQPLPPDTTTLQPWSLHFQQTVIQQWHNKFAAPRTGSYSLQPVEKAKLSLTTTLFVGRRLWHGASLYFNPEVAGGSGLSGARGIAGFVNGETFRIGNPAPQLYLARLFLRQVWNLGTEQTTAADAPNQLSGPAPTHYVALNVGKFSLSDYFDLNSYSHDPRTQFFNWSLMSTGAWDYPANTRGYTVGAVGEYVTPAFALRVASTLVPREANGPTLEKNYGRSHSETLELTKTTSLHSRPGAVRLLGFITHANMGDYRLATQRPDLDLTATRALGRTKYGLSANVEQALTDQLGVFARASFNDGRHETWAFTEIDQSVSVGASSGGTRWHRPDDRLGLAFVGNGISQPHRDFLAAGGHGFIIGDGYLKYAPELIGEVYYSFNIPKYFLTISPDYQFVVDPGYNRDRGPVHVVAVRAHVAF